MIRIRKHIASFLFVIFFFPITFQPIHIVWHHSHGYNGKQYLTNKILSDKDPHTNQENISKEEKLCPIGEYQFSINDLPEFPVFRTEIPVFACNYNEIAIQQPYKQVFSDKIPRAPPVLIS